MLTLYFPSLLLLFLATFFFLPFLSIRGHKNVGVVLFYLCLFFMLVARPYQDGIDNSNYVSLLTNEKFLSSDFLTDDFFKYVFLYLLAYPIPGTWQKLFFLNVLCITSLVFVQYNFIRRVSSYPLSFNGTFVFLLLSYDAVIIPPLALVHFKQFLAFLVINYLCFNNIGSAAPVINSSNFLLSLLVLLIHPAYIGFIFFFYLYHFIHELFHFITRFSANQRLLIVSFIIPLVLFFVVITPFLFKFISLILPGFSGYSLDISSPPSNGFNFGLVYPFILPLPLLLYSLFSFSPTPFSLSNHHRYTSIILLYFLILCVSYTELTFSTFYSIGRLKSSLYPCVFLILSRLYPLRLNSKFTFSLIWLSMFSISALTFQNLILKF